MQVGDVHASELEAYDLLIVGAPTHGGRASDGIRAFLNQIRVLALDGINVAGFDTRMTNRPITMFGPAAPKIAKALQKEGGILVGPPAGL